MEDLWNYLVLGPSWLILGVAVDYFPANGISKTILIPLLAGVSALVAWGWYMATMPVCQQNPFETVTKT